MEPKPAFLASSDGAQFQDKSVAAVYRKRPPYPPGIFQVISRSCPAPNRHVLELGAGTGEICIPLAGLVDSVQAVDPSKAMIDVARTIPGFDRVTWHNTTAENFDYQEEFGLIVCAQSLGWMDWENVFPRMASSLHKDGWLAVVEQGELADPVWLADLHRLISRYSTNQDYVPFNLIEGVIERGLFHHVRIQSLDAMPFQQSIEDFIDSIHARNGFSRDRMTELASTKFDQSVRRLLQPHHSDGIVRGGIDTRVVLGKPMFPTAP